MPLQACPAVLSALGVLYRQFYGMLSLASEDICLGGLFGLECEPLNEPRESSIVLLPVPFRVAQNEVCYLICNDRHLLPPVVDDGSRRRASTEHCFHHGG